MLSGSPPVSVTIGTGGTATLAANKVDDSQGESASMVTARVTDGTGYTAGSPGSATVTVNDNDDPTPPPGTNMIWIDRIEPPPVTEGSTARAHLSISPAPMSDVRVSVAVEDSGLRLGRPS